MIVRLRLFRLFVRFLDDRSFLTTSVFCLLLVIDRPRYRYAYFEPHTPHRSPGALCFRKSCGGYGQGLESTIYRPSSRYVYKTSLAKWFDAPFFCPGPLACFIRSLCS